ncbi:MAG: hypothetical protein K8T10_21855 [Candidatus Eremiobacteraeota bacterium]|nr:hypothetical protein [Candidatus Eremiobacteraeota bacterium]
MKQRNWTIEKKMEIVLEGLRGETSIKSIIAYISFILFFYSDREVYK